MTILVRVLLLVVLLSVGAGCAPRGLPVKISDATLPTSEEEKQLGAILSNALLQYLGGEYPDSTLQHDINEIGRRLVGGGDNGPIVIRIANHSDPLSLSLPGGVVILTRGLIQEFESEAQLAALLALEHGHFQAGYVTENMGFLVRGRAVLLHEVRPGEPGYSQRLALLREVTELLRRKGYGSRNESSADVTAIDLLVRAGYPLDGFFELNDIWERQTRIASVAGRSVHPYVLSSQRLQSVRDYIAASHPGYRGVADSDSTAYVRQQENLLHYALAYERYNQARLAEVSNDQSTALQLYHQAIQQHPESMLLTALGMAYLRGEDLIPARRYLRQAKMVDADFYQSRLGLGYIHLRRSEWSDAVDELEASLSLLPTLQGVFLLAEAEEGRGDGVRARNLYQHLIEVDGRSALGRAAAERLRHLPR